ncbi:MAG: endonuclease [Bacteroidaceae bacterium]|nr:endonuclease [Bacteroidaceae bacterium]
MKHSKTLFALLAMTFLLAVPADAKKDKDNLRLLYWNIQNGMWDGQTDNYDRFVNWVKAQDADICVWCEAQSIFKSNTADFMDKKDRFFVDGWAKTARRYGHKYVYVGGHHDNYPQVITSRMPIHNVARLLGSKADTLVCHGGGWATVEKNGHTINVVTLHTWPQAYGYGVKAEDRQRSAANHEGDYFRRTEMEYIINHTIGQVKGGKDQLWMMMGDFNSRSPQDNDTYNWSENSTGFLVHNYILKNSPYLDLIKETHRGQFIPSMGHGRSRIDFIYVTPPMLNRVKASAIIWDLYTTPIRDPQNLSNFWRPSDHLPIMVDFDMSR